jgi:hypothetical protein
VTVTGAVKMPLKKEEKPQKQTVATPLPKVKNYRNGGIVRGFSPIARPQKFLGIF